LRIAFDDINASITHATFMTAQNKEWQNADFIVYWIDPILHRLLGTTMHQHDQEKTDLLESVSRLGICLFLGPIRLNCGKLGCSTKVYVRKLKDLLSQYNDDVGYIIPEAMLLWVLFFGMLESWDLPEEEWFVDLTASVDARMNLYGWENIWTAVRSFLWMNNMFATEIKNIRGSFVTKLSLYSS